MADPDRLFDMRLGLALHKTRREIHALPYPEWKDWWLFSLIEPWGFENEDINTARIMAMIHNTNAKKPKPVKDFMRNTQKEILDALRNMNMPDMSEMSAEERKQAIYRAVKRDLGIHD